MLRVIKHLEPKNKRFWKRIGDVPLPQGITGDIWQHNSGLRVISSVETIDKEIGAEYHISVSFNGRRATSNEAKIALKAFDMEHSDEDNHGVKARHFFRPVADNKAEYVCPCKETETAIKLDKGDFIYRPLELKK